ncbi:peptidoglycan DD-metalloendopeptidase family protein [Ruminococcus sp.]|uniref:peptidoglycan DD-metalloendopeptidase family protein n=1 Tax=Ruminococcus sp. TaxID=41978 RepID=UPI0025FDB83E|nr:peptidoglycan DD-metalloendopeptidase family protein [Ruminococcus sp.]
MLVPYKGKFRVSQEYKGSAHDGLDLVGIDSKNIYATVSGRVTRAGWENPGNHKQGFGRYVRIDCTVDGEACCAYYGHLSQVLVRVGDTVKAGQLIGVEGSTGHSTGSHCHYCIRLGGVKGQQIDINKHSGVPNAKGTYDSADDVKTAARNIKLGSKGDDVKELQRKLIAAGYSCGPTGADGICGKNTVAAIRAYQRDHGLSVDGIAGPKTIGELNK